MARLRRTAGGVHDVEAIDAASLAVAHVYYPLYAFGAGDFAASGGALDPQAVGRAREALAALAAAGLPGHDRRRLARHFDKAVAVVARDRQTAEDELRAAMDFLRNAALIARGYPPRH